MKFVYLVFLTVGCAQLLCVRGYAGQSSEQQSSKHASNGQSSDKRGMRDYGATNSHVPQQLGLKKSSNPAKEIPGNRQHSSSLHSTNFGQPLWGRVGSIQNKATANVVRVRPSSDVRRVAPSPKAARHRGANPAAIDGSSSRRRNTGTLDGRDMNRRP
jgi:hypothetical protein